MLLVEQEMFTLPEQLSAPSMLCKDCAVTLN